MAFKLENPFLRAKTNTSSVVPGNNVIMGGSKMAMPSLSALAPTANPALSSALKSTYPTASGGSPLSSALATARQTVPAVQQPVAPRPVAPAAPAYSPAPVSYTAPPVSPTYQPAPTRPTPVDVSQFAGSYSQTVAPAQTTPGLMAPAPQSTLMAQREALRKQLAGYQVPSGAESQAQAEYDAKVAEADRLALETQQAVYGVEGQGRGIPLQILRGQQLKINQQGELAGQGLQLEQQTLQQKLARAQAEREMQYNALSGQISDLNTDIESTKPFSLGDAGIASFNPVTGKYEIMNTPQMSKPVSVAQGSSLVDPVTGQVIYGGQQADEQLSVADAKALGVPYGTTKSQAAAMGKIPSSGSDGLTPYQQFQGAMSLANQVQRFTDGARTVANNAQMMNDAYQRYSTGQGDLNATSQVIISTFNKILDPSSVVRETEYARSSEGVSLLQRLEGKAVQIQQGGAGLTPQALKEFVDLANQFSQRAQQSIVQEQQRAKQFGEQYGIDTSFVGGGSYPGVTPTGGGGDALDSLLQGVGFKGDLSRSVNGSTLTVQLPSGQVHQGGSASWRNNNPLNIKNGQFASKYGAGQGSAATDGGNFAAFPSVEVGMKAARDLLRAPSYTGLSLEAAMRRWSGSGYGADVAPPDLRGKTTAQMTDQELNRLIEAMRQREGWKIGSVIA